MARRLDAGERARIEVLSKEGLGDSGNGLVGDGGPVPRLPKASDAPAKLAAMGRCGTGVRCQLARPQMIWAQVNGPRSLGCRWATFATTN